MRFLPPFLIDANLPLEVEVARQSLRLRAQQSVHARTTIIAAVVVAAITFSFTTPWWQVVSWGLPVIVMAQINAMVCRRTLAAIDAADATGLARHQATLWWMTVINQLLMGLLVWWIGYGNATGAATIATVLQLVYVGGAMVNASTHPPTFISGAWINLGLAALFWVTQSSDGLAFPLAMLVMGLLMAKASTQTASAFRDSLRMRFENIDLIKQLAKEKLVAETANAAKSRFLAAASHDLRQPLHALLLFASLLTRDQQDKSPLLGHIRDAATSLDKLFTGLLDISKLETGSVVPQFQAVNLRVVADDLVREYAPACEAHGVRIEARGAEAWILTDPFLLERIMRNLVDNAVKYTSAGEIVIEIEEGLSVVELRISDTGIGIEPAMRQTIFEEYFQLDNPSRDPSRGVGLGLAIVRRLADLLRTPVDLVSETGKGSTFTLLFQKAPIFSSMSGGIATVEDDTPLLNGLCVWLVEDNDLVRTATCQALEAWGCTAVAWTQPPEQPAVEAATKAPDALITDYRLALGSTGVDVIKRLRGRWPQLPVAVMTGDPTIERSRFDDMGDVTIMQKPVLPEVLVKWLAAAGSRQKVPQQIPSPN